MDIAIVRIRRPPHVVHLLLLARATLLSLHQFSLRVNILAPADNRFSGQVIGICLAADDGFAGCQRVASMMLPVGKPVA